MTPEEFKEARRQPGLTQAGLGEGLDTAPQTIRKVTGFNPRRRTRA